MSAYRKSSFPSSLLSALVAPALLTAGLALSLTLGAACSSTTTVVGAPPGDASAAADSADIDDDAGIGKGDSSTPTTCTVEPDPAMSDVARVQKCIACCDAAHTDPSFYDALQVCACTLDSSIGPGACFTDCKTSACAATPKTPSASCSQCRLNAMRVGGDCVPFLTKACQTEAPDCAAHLKCISGCNP